LTTLSAAELALTPRRWKYSTCLKVPLDNVAGDHIISSASATKGIIIGLAGSDPTVVIRADLRNMLQWQLKSHAAQYGRTIPADELESMVDEGERRALRHARQMTYPRNRRTEHGLRILDQFQWARVPG
jgi:hypothetical protein